MRNILKMNLFRMKSTRIVYAMAIVSLGLSLLFFGIDWLITSALSDISDFVNNPPGMEPAGTNVWGITRNTMMLGSVPLGAVMATLLFFFTEVSTGYAKNLVGYETNKYDHAGADLLTSAFYTGCLMLVTVILFFILAVLGYDNPEFGNAGKFFVWLVISFIEVLAFITLLKALSDATGKTILFMILGGVYPLLASSVYQLIDLAVIFGLDVEDFAVEKYTLLGGISSYNLSAEWSGLIILGVIAAAVLVGAYLLDVLALKKRELK
ncbi:MAG: hypothetical protein MJ192_09385 [Clostridia bacterium]|nr:hypothetical protein [Clostridia bacterium]